MMRARAVGTAGRHGGRRVREGRVCGDRVCGDRVCDGRVRTRSTIWARARHAARAARSGAFRRRRTPLPAVRHGARRVVVQGERALPGLCGVSRGLGAATVARDRPRSYTCPSRHTKQPTPGSKYGRPPVTRARDAAVRESAAPARGLEVPAPSRASCSGQSDDAIAQCAATSRGVLLCAASTPPGAPLCGRWASAA